MSEQPDTATVLFVAGAGRSGTSTLAVLLQLLGMHVPQPEVAPDESNPKGFGEPQWAVDFHGRLLAEATVAVADARPAAWEHAAAAAARPDVRRQAGDWLADQLAGHRDLVVKDPRLSWFLDLWRETAQDAGARPVFVTMLRPPAEVIGSRLRYYHSRLGTAHLAASWVNVLLHTELATRAAGERRVFVRYADLLADWGTVTSSVAERLGLRPVLAASAEQRAECDRFVDPSLRRVSLDLGELELPARLHDLTRDTWDQLNLLAEPGGDTVQVRDRLDGLRDAYVTLYEESEAITKSTVVAATASRRRPPPEVVGTPRASMADKIPHRVRAAVPPGVRRALRRLLNRPH